MKSLRGTGRTTRMVQDAVEQARNGRAVYIICADPYHKQEIDHIVNNFILSKTEKSNIKLETPESVGNFSFETMSLRGAHSNCRVFVDHYTIERRFRLMLEELHRYDQ